MPPTTSNPSSTLPATFLKLLGSPRLYRGEHDITAQVKYRKGWALLGFLAAHPGQWQQRAHLAELLWPHLENSAARTNLRQVLNNLSGLLDGSNASAALERDSQRVRYVLGRGLDADIHTPTGGDMEALLSQEELLDGIAIPSRDYEEWLLELRRTLHLNRLQQLQALVGLLQRAGRHAEALTGANRLCALAPRDETYARLQVELQRTSNDAQAAAIPLTGNFKAQRRESPPLPELRHVTALYCDLGLSIEDSKGVDGDLLLAIVAVLQRHGGTLISAIGSGVLALFGLPPAVERPTERALLAAGDLRRGPCHHLCLNIGVAAGQVLHQQQASPPFFFGHAPDRATLLGWHAESGEMLLDEAAAQQIGHLFSLQAAPACPSPHGKPPVPSWRLGGATPQRHNGDSAALPLAGRHGELHKLQQLWNEVLGGAPRIAIARAAAGMGKTRLTEELARYVHTQGHQVYRIECRLELQHRPLGAVIACLESEADIAAHDPEPLKREKLKRHLSLTAPQMADPQTTSLLEAIGSPALDAHPLQAKRQLFAAMLQLLVTASSRGPVLLLVDDLHWADMATLEILDILVNSMEEQPILLMLAGRNDLLEHLSEPNVLRLELPPLDMTAALVLIDTADWENKLSKGVKQHIAFVCGGIPLFLQRLTRDMAEGRTYHQPIAELLQSELDRLGAAKDVLRSAAVQGSSFSSAFLGELLPDTAVVEALDAALAQNLIVPLRDDLYEFSHALIRDAAYNSLPEEHRQRLHRHTAYLLQERGGSPSEAVARHFAAGLCWEEAAHWWNQAGNEAMSREFASDALRCFEAAEKICASNGLQALQATQLRLGYAAQMAQGFGSPLAHRLFSQVAANLEGQAHLGGNRRIAYFTALSGRYMGGSSQGEVEGLNIARRLQSIAQSDTERLMASFALGNSLFWRGELMEAKQWQETGIDIATRLLPRDRIRFCVDDPAVTCRAFLAWNLWFQGDEEKAVATADESVQLARQSGRIHALCFALTFAVAVHWSRDDCAEVFRLGEEGRALAAQYGLPLWQSVNSLFLLGAAAHSGKLADNGALFAAAAQMQEAYHAGITTSRWIAVRALLAQKAWNEAETLLDVTIDEAVRYEDEYCLADILWLKGECLLQRQDTAGGEAYFRQAERLAATQQADGLLRRFAAWRKRQTDWFLES